MAVRSKILASGRRFASGAPAPTVYVCPADKTAIIKSLVLINLDLAVTYQQVYVSLLRVTHDAPVWRGSMAPLQLVERHGLYLPMHPGDALRLFSNAASGTQTEVAYNLSGVELQGVAP